MASLYRVSYGQVDSPQDLNQVIAVLQHIAGEQETGKYFVAGLSTAASQTISNYIPTLSRNATPASVSFDTTDATPSGTLNAPATGHLSAGGFQMSPWSTLCPYSMCVIYSCTICSTSEDGQPMRLCCPCRRKKCSLIHTLRRLRILTGSLRYGSVLPQQGSMCQP